MRLAEFNKRKCLINYDYEAESLSVIKEVIESGIVADGLTYFFAPPSRMFFVKKGTIVRTYRYRENWNGYHDVAAYDLDTSLEIGVKIDANYSEGRHRDVVID